MSNIRNIHSNNFYTSMWNILFDKNVSQWCSFKPKKDAIVYPCYACRDMFGNKISLIDHVNRRSILISYFCKICTEKQQWIFYNSCAFLLHARRHFNNNFGEIDLDCLKISVLPMEMVGFSLDDEQNLIYNVVPDTLGQMQEISTRFYSPTSETFGFRIVTLNAIILMFDNITSAEDGNEQLVLKQISSNIPFCKFVSFNVTDCISNTSESPHILNEVKEEPIDCEYTWGKDKEERCITNFTTKMYVQKKPTTLKSNKTKCPICHETQINSIIDHMVGKNVPFNSFLKCNICFYIAPTKCSLKAHMRIHGKFDVYVCPECGKKFNSISQLIEHCDDVCFHYAKNVRMKCPARNCKKLFAQINTLIAHMKNHLHIIKSEQSDTHNSSDILIQCLICPVLSNIFFESATNEHLQTHCSDLNNVYVYICKYCRKYYKSLQNYASHTITCSKISNGTKRRRKNIIPICTCSEYHGMVYKSSHICARCLLRIPIPSTLNSASSTNNKICNQICKLCDSTAHKTLSAKCEYSNPQVVVKKLSELIIDSHPLLQI